MTYTDKFLPTDELINEINTLKPHISQVALPKFTGAISVSAVTSYELAIKEILIDYAHSKHNLFGCFVQNYLSRLNGRIEISDLKKEIKKIDNALAANWEEKITEVERVRINLDYDECINDFNIGKKIIEALRSVMV